MSPEALLVLRAADAVSFLRERGRVHALGLTLTPEGAGPYKYVAAEGHPHPGDAGGPWSHPRPVPPDALGALLSDLRALRLSEPPILPRSMGSRDLFLLARAVCAALGWEDSVIRIRLSIVGAGIEDQSWYPDESPDWEGHRAAGDVASWEIDLNRGGSAPTARTDPGEALNARYYPDHIALMERLREVAPKSAGAVEREAAGDLTIGEAAARIGVSRAAIQGHLRRGNLPGARKEAGTWRIPSGEADALPRTPGPKRKAVPGRVAA